VMSQKLPLIVFGAVTLVLLALGIASGAIIWAECREVGHSALYCWRLAIG